MKKEASESFMYHGVRIYRTENKSVKYYAICSKCKKLVRLNKPLFGSVHFCTYDGKEL